MREMINEATRTIEDSQTAQALHGLLSLNSDSGASNFPALLRAVGQQVTANQQMAVTQSMPTPHHQQQVYSDKALPVSQAKDVHLMQTPDGQTIEVAEVPPAVSTVVVSSESSDSPSTSGANVGHLSQIGMAHTPPTPTQPPGLGHLTKGPQPLQGGGKTKAGSVMELLLQMQSQANAAAAQAQSSESHTSPTPSSVPLASIANLLSQTQFAVTTTAHQPIQPAPAVLYSPRTTSTVTHASLQAAVAQLQSPKTPTHILPAGHIPRVSVPINISQSPKTAPHALNFSVAQSPKVASQTFTLSTGQSPKVATQSAQALTQLIQAQVKAQPAQCRPSQLTPSSPQLQQVPPQLQVSPSAATVAALIRASKAQTLTPQALPFQILANPGSMTPQIIQTERSSLGEIILSPTSLQPMIIQPQTVILATSAATATTPTIPTTSVKTLQRPPSVEEHNKSPLKKRPYPLTVTEVNSHACSSPPEKRLCLGVGVGAGGDAISRSSSAVVVKQQPSEVISVSQPISLTSHVESISPTSSTGNKHGEFTAIVTPILKKESDDESQKVQTRPAILFSGQQQSVAVHISEGFDDIFRYLRTQGEQLRQDEANSGSGPTMKNVIEKVMTETITKENGDNQVMGI